MRNNAATLGRCATITAAAFGLYVALLLLADVCLAQEGPAWRQEARTAATINNDSHLFLEVVADVLGEVVPDEAQAIMDAIEAALFPPPTDPEKRAALEAARRQLVAAGLADEDPLIAAVDAEIDKLPAEI